MSHPVNQFLLIRRFSSDWREVAAELEAEDAIPDFESLLLTNEEMVGASQALSRLSDVYNVEPIEFARGNVSHDAPTMSPAETFQIGRTLYLQKEYYHCAKWMKATQNLLLPSALGSPFYSDVLDYQSYCYSQAGNMPKAMELTNQILSFGVHTDMERIQGNSDFYREQLERSPREVDEDFLQRPNHWNEEERDIYERLCAIGTNNSEIIFDGVETNLKVSKF